MSVDKQYRVLIHSGDKLLCTFTLNTEWGDEFIDVSSTFTDGEPNDESLVDEAVDVILEAESAHGKESINGCTLEWFLIN